MCNTDYKKMYAKIFKILDDLTPLYTDCGVLCDGACCKGDSKLGMRPFPGEQSFGLMLTPTDDGIIVCDGSCDRNKRPLACRIFPFFPTIDEKGKIFVEPDYRAYRLCPLLSHSDEIVFNPKFFKALKRVGKILAKDEKCREFLYESTEEIDIYRKFLAD